MENQPLTDEKTLTLKSVNRPDVLNVLRVIAILIVFILHARGFIGSDADYNAYPFFSVITLLPAWAGVWILFFLSGYLMEKGFSAGRYAVIGNGFKNTVRNWALFMLKRFLKIAPLYYAYIILFTVLSRSTFVIDSPLRFLSMFVFLCNGEGNIAGLGHLWYISPLMWLYLFAPLFAFIIEKLKKKRSILLLLIMLIAVFGALRYVIFHSGADWYRWIYTFFPMNFDLFFGGMCVCALVSEKHVLKRNVLTALKWISVILFAATLFSNCFLYYKGWVMPYRIVYPSVYLIACAFLLFCFDGNNETRTKPDLSNIKKNPLRLLDVFSPVTYSFYLLHISVFLFLSDILNRYAWYSDGNIIGKWFLFITLSFLITLLLSVIFNKLSGVLLKVKRKK